MTTKLILTQEQAEAILIAGTALSAVHGQLDTVIVAPGEYLGISVWANTEGRVKVAHGMKAHESYDNWTAFADAYAAHYGLTIVEPESTIDRMVREAQERLAKQLDRDVAVHSAEITVAHWTFMFERMQREVIEPAWEKSPFNLKYGKTAKRHPLDHYGFTFSNPALSEKVMETGHKALRAMAGYKIPEKASRYGVWIDDDSEGARPGAKVWKDYAPHLAKRHPPLESAKSYWQRLWAKKQLNACFGPMQ